MITCEGIVRIYKSTDTEVLALRGLDLQVETGEMMAIIGNSGSGKSTLLHILGGLDQPSAGSITLDALQLTKATREELDDFRRRTVGYVWQINARNLLTYLTALENVELPMMLNGKPDHAYAKKLLEWVGLSDKLQSKLNQLSGGEQQRVAVAIALANRPKLLLADEPTGSVDSVNAERMMDIFRTLNRELGLTIVIVTHDLLLAGKVDRVVAIRDGLTSSEFVKRNPDLTMTSTTTASLNLQTRYEELSVVDRAGRLQLPKAFREAAGIQGKARVELEGKRIVVYAPLENQ